jgi:uncharacterized repeat protein (TIGR01451 family)
MKRTINFRIVLALGLGLTLAALCLSLNPGLARSKAPTAELHVCPVGCLYSSIQAAVDAADEGDVIKVATGIYTDVSVRPRNDVTTASVVTQVVYISKTVTIQGGYAITDWTVPYPITQSTTVDAQGQGRALYITGDISPTIEGLRITGGNAAGLGGWPGGGDTSGGVYIFASTAKLSHSLVFSNVAEWGSGVALISSAAKLDHNAITSNTASIWGGGLVLLYSAATLSYNTVSGNITNGEGGGLVLDVSLAQLNGNIVTSNTAHRGGGLSIFSDAILTNNVIADNQTDAEGGGLFILSASPHLIHTTIAHNSSHGVYVTNDAIHASNVAMTDTILVSHSVGVVAPFGDLVTVNGVLWFANAVNAGGNVVTTHEITGNPAFAADGYHLTTTSAAIDQGVDAGVTTDIDGQPRPIGLAPDLGADEFEPATRYVATSGVDTGDCSNNISPCRTVQYAVDIADEGNTIKVAAGVYTSTSSRSAPLGYSGPTVITQAVYITKSLMLKGSYTTTNWITSNPNANPTVLDAQKQGRVVFIAGDISPTIEGFRIIGGEAADLGGQPEFTFDNDAGGGIYILTATANLVNNTIMSNTVTFDQGYARNGGAGLYLAYSKATLDGNNIIYNVTTPGSGMNAGNGGGLLLYKSNAMLTGNLVSQNTANCGGGFYLKESAPILISNTISCNTASYGAGGGLYLSNSGALLTGNLIISNTVGYGNGGGLSLYESGGSLVGNIVSGNWAQGAFGVSGGGGLDLYRSSPLFMRNAINHNRTSELGGGLLLTESDAVFVNNSIDDNQANKAGSGIYVSSSSPHLLHTTIARNIGGDGTGIYVTNSGTVGTVALTNTILTSQTVGISVTVGNTATLNGVLWFDNGTNAGGDGFITVTDAITGDPAFAPDGYHLTATSAAIDQGVDAGITTDIDGDHRPAGAGYDLGVDEFYPTSALIVTKQADPDPVQAGAPLIYILRVTNTGNVDLHATITDTLPVRVTPAGILTWTPTITAPGGIWSQQVIVTVETGFAGPLTNTVQATTLEGATGIYTKTSTAFVSQPNLQVTKHASSDLVQAGSSLTYTFLVTNTGNMDLHAAITDTLPAHVTPDGILTWTPTITAPGGVWSQQVVVTVEMGYAGPLTNTVQATTLEGATGIYTATAQAQVTPMLQVTKSANANSVQAGSSLTYTLLVTNTGNMDLHATITDTLPAHVTPGGILTWMPTITAPGDVWSHQVVVTVEQGYTGTLTNNVQVTTIEGATGSDSVTVQAHGYRIYLPLVLRQSS